MNEKLRDHINEARMTLGYMVNILIRYGKTVDLLQFEECEPQSIAALNVFYRELRKENQRIQSLYNKYTEQELENTKKNKFARFQPSSADSHCNMSLQAFLLSYFSLFPAGSCDAKSRVEGGPRLKRSATVGALGKVFSNTIVGSLFSQSATCIVPYSDLQAKTERRQHRQSISTTV